MKNARKNAVFLDLRFGGLFGGVWEGFWEAKILDFRTFFDVFSKSFLKCVSEGEKKKQTFPLFGVGFAVYGTCLGRDCREGKRENFGDTCR